VVVINFVKNLFIQFTLWLTLPLVSMHYLYDCPLTFSALMQPTPKITFVNDVENGISECIPEWALSPGCAIHAIGSRRHSYRRGYCIRHVHVVWLQQHLIAWVEIWRGPGMSISFYLHVWLTTNHNYILKCKVIQISVVCTNVTITKWWELKQ
jgi:hypothetical protein